MGPPTCINPKTYFATRLNKTNLFKFNKSKITHVLLSIDVEKMEIAICEGDLFLSAWFTLTTVGVLHIANPWSVRFSLIYEFQV